MVSELAEDPDRAEQGRMAPPAVGRPVQLPDAHLDLPRTGDVRAGDAASLPYYVADACGAEVVPASQYLRDLALGDASPSTVRSYAYDLLRWWRTLEALGVAWDKATTGEVAALVGWLRTARNPQRRRSSGPAPGTVNLRTGKASLAEGYAASTINHALSVLSGFYAFHAHYGRGPVVNPVPDQPRRRAALGHRSPIEPHQRVPRARLRQRVPDRAPRSVPDHLWGELLAAMTCDRDRALLALYVSSGARATELLGLRLEHVDWAGKRIWIVSKGSRLLEAIPASPEAFAYLALYLDEHGLPAEGQPVWRALHGEPRPLTYSAMRAVLNRANAKLGTNWTAHDLRHTAASRMAGDPELSIVEVQAVLRHRHLSTTERYTQVRIEELVERLQRHYARPQPTRHLSPGYDPEDVRAVFGG
ncbi:MAG: tyrosine-type recombinase/integrase [Chloroflexota bacterium]